MSDLQWATKEVRHIRMRDGLEQEKKQGNTPERGKCMKKLITLGLLLACMLAGCGQKEVLQEATPTKESTPTAKPTPKVDRISIVQTSGGGAPSPTLAQGEEAEDGVFQYKESGNTDCFAVDEAGLLYIMTGHPTYTQQLIKIYDWDGNWTEKHILKIGTGKAEHLLVGENCLYVLIPEEDCANVLYQIDLTTWEAKRLYDFTQFNAVYDMVLIKDTIYVLGEYKNYKEIEFLNYEEWYDRDPDRANIVAYVQVTDETPELAVIPFDLPNCILVVDEEMSGIYGKEERYTHRLFAYSPEEKTLQGISAGYGTGEMFNAFPLIRRPFQCYEDGIFMFFNKQDEAIYYVSQDGTDHEILRINVEFYLHNTMFADNYNKKIVYVNGCLIYQEDIPYRAYNVMHRVNIEDTLKEIIPSE